MKIMKINQKIKCIVPQTMISATERSKPGKRDRASQGWWGSGGVGGKMFSGGLRLRLIRKVTSEQSSGGVGGVAHAALQGKGAPARGENKPESLS